MMKIPCDKCITLDRRLYITTGSYGYEFLRDRDDPQWVTKKMKNYMSRRAEEKSK